MNPTLAEMQIEAIRSVLEDILTASGSVHPAHWGLPLLGDLNRILDMTSETEVQAFLDELEEKRAQRN